MIIIGNITYLWIAAFISLFLLALNFFTIRRIKFHRRRDILRNFMWSGIILFLGMIISNAKLNWEYPAPIKEKAEIIFAIDASLSALAQDVVIKENEQIRKISRLDLEKKQVKNVIEDLKGDAIGIIAFANEALPLQIVLSREDYKNTLIRNLRNIDEIFVRHEISQGTDYGNLILVALNQFGKKSNKKKVIFVLTDGESQGDEAKLQKNMEKAMKVFIERDDISIYLIGIGNTRESSKIPQTEDEEGNPKEYYRQKEGGDFILTRPNPEFLTNLANATGGHYLHAASDKNLKNILGSSIERERRIISFEKQTKAIDLTPYLLISSLVFLFVIPFIKSV